MIAKPTILVIDDDPLFRKTMNSIFSQLGLNVKTTALAEQFMEYAFKFKPDLFMINLQLTDVTGFDLIKKLRQVNQKAAIIVISGEEGQEQVTHALEVGANDFILKPLDRSVLISKLSRYLGADLFDEDLAKSVSPPKGRTPAKLTFKVEISDIDELGIVLMSRHLIPKGTLLKLKADLLKEIRAPLEELVVMVTSNSFNSATGFYSTYAEFEEISQEFSEALRQWINSAKP